jgi:hypothetical protein
MLNNQVRVRGEHGAIVIDHHINGGVTQVP